MSIVGCDGQKRLNDRFLQGLVSTGFDSSQEGFEFGKGLLHDHDLPWTQGWSQNLLDVLLKDRSGGGSLHDHALAHPLPSQRSNQGRILAAIARNRSDGPFSFGCPPVTWGQSDIGATFIDEQQAVRIQLLGLGTPGGPLLWLLLACS
jgi:hypothetical protein